MIRLAVLVIFSVDKLRSNTHLEMVRTRRMLLSMIPAIILNMVIRQGKKNNHTKEHPSSSNHLQGRLICRG